MVLPVAGRDLQVASCVTVSPFSEAPALNRHCLYTAVAGHEYVSLISSYVHGTFSLESYSILQLC